MHGLRVGVLTKAELAPGHHPLGPGRRGRGARRRPRLHRPPPGRHAGRRRRAVRRRRGAGAGRRGPGARQRAHRPGRRVRPRRRRSSSQLAREGGHSLARVVHAGGAATGAEIERALVDAVRRHRGRACYERWFALDLLVERRPLPRRAWPSTPTGERHEVPGPPRAARHRRRRASSSPSPPTRSRSPATASPWRCAPAWRCADVEFMQFHPTALHHPRDAAAAAVRGAARPRRADPRHRRRAVRRRAAARATSSPGPSPRACSSRASTTCWLDATGLEHFDERFPTIAAALREAGLDPATDWLPIAPAAHYLLRRRASPTSTGRHVAPRAVGRGRGGVHRRARRQPPGVELAARGHGVRAPGRRGHRGRGRTGPETDGRHALRARPWRRRVPATWAACRSSREAVSTDRRRRGRRARIDADADRLQRAMTAGAGVLRSAESLTLAGARRWSARRRRRGRRPRQPRGSSPTSATSDRARGRRGTPGRRAAARHTRTDFPDRDDAHFRARLIHR